MKIIRGNEELCQYFKEKGQNQVSNAFIEGVTVFHTTVDDQDSNIVEASNCVFRNCNFTTNIELSVFGNVKFDNCTMPRFQGYSEGGSDYKTISFTKCKIESFHLDKISGKFIFSEIGRVHLGLHDNFTGCSINSVVIDDIVPWTQKSFVSCNIGRIEFTNIFMDDEYNKEIEMLFSLSKKDIDVVCYSVGINNASINGLGLKNYRFCDCWFSNCSIKNCDFSESKTARNFYLLYGTPDNDVQYDIYFQECDVENTNLGDAKIIKAINNNNFSVFFNKSGGGVE